jgi:hypothetical protein
MCVLVYIYILRPHDATLPHLEVILCFGSSGVLLSVSIVRQQAIESFSCDVSLWVQVSMHLGCLVNVFGVIWAGSHLVRLWELRSISCEYTRKCGLNITGFGRIGASLATVA